MDAELRGNRDAVEGAIEDNARVMLANGSNPFEVQNYRMEKRQELARAIPDTQKYAQATNLAAQFIQKKTA
jgi:hypothetical protein